MEEEQGDKPYEPSARKLDQQREKGEIARSPDVMAFAAYLGFLVTVVAFAPAATRRTLEVGGALLADADRLAAEALSGGDLMPRALIGATLQLAAWWLVLPAAFVVAAVVATRAWVVAPERMMFKAQRISPVSGAKNKFGPTGLFEFAKSGTKMCVYGALLGFILWSSADRIVASAALPLGQAMTLLARLILGFVAAVAAVSGLIAAIDFAWQHAQHRKKNRMSHKEMRDEHKDVEGDPMLKQKRRQRAEEIATNKMMQDVPDAAVVVVNPTHYAVALKWSPTDPTPPVCVAKGVDAVAARIREAAEEARVPIFSDPPTARALHATVDLGEPIPREHFQAVAAAIRFAGDLRAAAGGQR